jgi:hypothetical protein
MNPAQTDTQLNTTAQAAAFGGVVVQRGRVLLAGMKPLSTPRHI